MISTKTEDHHKRRGAKCTECENLQECKLRDIILSTYIQCCNYAAEGCNNYIGNYIAKSRVGGDRRDYRTHKALNLSVRDKILTEGFALSECEAFGINSTRLHNNLTVLKERGATITKQGSGKEVRYFASF
jgi:hypothetical protein